MIFFFCNVELFVWNERYRYQDKIKFYELFMFFDFLISGLFVFYEKI